ncbi:MAG: hypothetical protein H6624_10295 [Bdellovibrionaceae bacterium]|nr:hypothetical protein [Bdellovibrionales bacterium]MCB9084724.1 hypothetical protein [Pseudobdellovibrionaceae bacterium]
MDTPKTAQQLVRQYLMIGRIIWGALVLASGVYAYVAYIMSAQKELSADQGPGDVFFQILVLLSVGMAISSILAKNWMLSRPVGGEPNHVKVMSDDQQRAIAEADPQTKAFILAYSQWLVAHIVALALAESVIIFGLVWSMVSGRFSEFMPFWLGGVLLMAWHFPRLRVGSGRRSDRRRY